MRQLLDFLPLIIFFVTYKFFDAFIATKALIIATTFTMIFLWFQFRKAGKTGVKEFLKAEKVPIFTFFLLLFFGSLTIYFHEFKFLVWKLTVVYAIFAAALLISQFIFNKPLIQSALGKEISLPPQIWSQVNLFWAVFFSVSSLINLYVGFYVSESMWFNFKVFIFPAIIFVLTLLTGAYIYRYLPKDAVSEEKSKTKHED